MSLELLKVLVQPVALERDPDGQIVGERVGDPVAIYDLDQVADYVNELRTQIQSPPGVEATTNGEPATERAPTV